MTRAVDDPAQLREQAALWVVRLQEAEHEAASNAAGRARDEDRAASLAQCKAACEAWCAADPRRRALLRQLQGLWQAADPAADDAPAGAGSTAAAAPARRRRVGVAAGLLSAAVLVGLSSRLGFDSLPMLAAWRADERSAVGEIRHVALPDGSRLVLNSGSAVDLDFGPGQRRVRLLAGEVLAEVAPDARRPFSVQGRDGEATARGTRYLVRQGVADTTVTVIEHSVTVAVRAPSPDAHANALVAAGQSVRLNASGVGEVHDAPAGKGAWADGRLVFVDAPLPQVLAELARYRHGLVRQPAGDMARLRFTGVLPARETEQALAQLERALPLRVRRATDYLVWVEPTATRNRE